MPIIKVATYNMWARSPARNVEADLNRLMPQVDVVGFQEFGMGRDIPQLEAAAQKFGFTVYRGADPSCPIAFRTDMFKVIKSGSEWLSDDTRVGKAGAGPNVLLRKDLNWIRLRHLESGRIFYFAVCHLAPSIHIRIRRELHAQQTDKVRDWAASRPNNVIIMGDFNVDARKDERDRDADMPFAKFGAINFVSNWTMLGFTKIGTHGNRLIDYIWFNNNPKRFKAISHRVLRRFNSDHRPVLVEFEVSLTMRVRIKRLRDKVRALRS